MTAEPTIGIVGSGTMGRGIAQLALGAPGTRVVMVDSDPRALQAARELLHAEHARLHARGDLTHEERLSREAALEVTTTYDDLARCGLVIEAVPEVLEIKQTVLATVSSVVDTAAIIASNTSSLSITALSRSITGRERFFGAHFFNPVPRMPLVEVIRTPLSDRGREVRLQAWLQGLGKTVVVVDDRPGFVVNALLVPFLLAAARMIDTGYATPEQVDEGIRLGAGHPMGPLALCDLIGLDVLCDIGDAMHTETKDPALVVPNNLRRMVDSGRLGRKSGSGFFVY